MFNVNDDTSQSKLRNPVLLRLGIYILPVVIAKVISASDSIGDYFGLLIGALAFIYIGYVEAIGRNLSVALAAVTKSHLLSTLLLFFSLMIYSSMFRSYFSPVIILPQLFLVSYVLTLGGAWASCSFPIHRNDEAVKFRRPFIMDCVALAAGPIVGFLIFSRILIQLGHTLGLFWLVLVGCAGGFAVTYVSIRRGVNSSKLAVLLLLILSFLILLIYQIEYQQSVVNLIISVYAATGAWWSR